MAETLALSNYLPTSSVTLTDEEKGIIDLKYKSIQFGKMNDIELLNECQILLLRLSVITGWVIPQAELKNILIENLCKKMIESYLDVNVKEVEYAFRNKGTNIIDWGKNFSLTLLDQVMQPYIEKRFSVSDLEQRIKNPPVQIIYTDEEILNQRREEIEKAFQAMKKGYYPILHSYFFQVLKDDDLIETITNEDGIRFENISEFFVRKLNTQVENIYIKNNVTNI